MRPSLLLRALAIVVVTWLLVVPTAFGAPSSGIRLYVTEGNYYGSSGGSLLRIDPSSGAVESLLPPGTPGVATGFATVVGNRIYWGGAEPSVGIPGVRSANLDGTDARVLVGSWLPMGVAVDEVHGKLYWAEAAQHAVRRSNLDGSDVEELVSGVGCCFIGSPMGLALDVPAGKVYWANMAQHVIQRANLDGTGVETVVSVPGWASGLAIDPVGAKLYWTDQGGSIWRSGLDGQNPTTVVTGIAGSVMDLAIDDVDGLMYWTVMPGLVMRATLDGGDVTTVAHGLAAVTGIAIVRSVDSTPPVLTLPARVTVDAVGPAGAIVTYQVAAADDTDPSPSVVCSPVSGSLFAIGSTIVGCVATDASGNSASGTFVIHVNGALEQLSDLRQSIVGVPPGTSLDDKLANVETALAAGDTAGACAGLAALLREVTAVGGKQLPTDLARSLAGATARIERVLRC